MAKTPTTAPETPIGEGADTLSALTPGGTPTSEATPAITREEIATAFAQPPEGEPVTAAEIQANETAFLANLEAKAAEVEAARADAEAAAAAAAEAPAEAEAPLLDLPTLSYLERQITQLNITGHRAGLVDELRDLYGLVIDQDDDLGTVTVTMQGITTDPADSLHQALENWGNAARRAISAALA